MVDTTPEEELFALPRLECYLEQKLQEGEARVLTRQLRRRFGSMPDWASEKVAKAEFPSLERWSLRIFDAQSLDDVFLDEI